ncbi:MAG: NIPSNAP family protein [Anaerolineaceae bacterium]|nr:NIPSNAP family protein [Anaerolineaceae bacterium]
MIYELRTYWAAEGKLENLHDRFRDVTLPIFKRLNMEVVGFWVPETRTEETGDLIYVLGFKSVEAKEAAWKTFMSDPVWVDGRARSENNGKLVTKVTSITMAATDYSSIQ